MTSMVDVISYNAGIGTAVAILEMSAATFELLAAAQRREYESFSRRGKHRVRDALLASWKTNEAHATLLRQQMAAITKMKTE